VQISSASWQKPEIKDNDWLQAVTCILFASLAVIAVLSKICAIFYPLGTGALSVALCTKLLVGLS
jgi:hypothetical protein